MTKFIAVSNRRGGVGKSTVTLMLACGLCAQSKSVLVVDLDPQSSTTSVFLRESDWKRRRESDLTVAGYLRRTIVLRQNAPIADFIAEQGVHQLVPPQSFFRAGIQQLPPLRIVPCSSDLDDREMEMLLTVFGYNRGLADAINDIQHRTREAIKALGVGHDYVIVDCPPGLSNIVWGALAAADGILIPYVADPTAESNIEWLLGNLDKRGIAARRATIPNRYTGKDGQSGFRTGVESRCPGFEDFYIRRTVQLERSLALPHKPFTLTARFGRAQRLVRDLATRVLEWPPA